MLWFSLFCNVQMRLDTLSFCVKRHLGCIYYFQDYLTSPARPGLLRLIYYLQIWWEY